MTHTTETSQKILNEQLLQAAREGDTGTVKSLIEKGANVDAKDNDGHTALRFAKRHRNKETHALLKKSMNQKG